MNEESGKMNRREFMKRATFTAAAAAMPETAFAGSEVSKEAELSEQEKANFMVRRFREKAATIDREEFIAQYGDEFKQPYLNAILQKLLEAAEETGLHVTSPGEIQVFLFNNGYYLNTAPIVFPNEDWILEVDSVEMVNVSQFEGVEEISGEHIDAEFRVLNVNSTENTLLARTDINGWVLLADKRLPEITEHYNSLLPAEWGIVYTQDQIRMNILENEAMHFVFRGKWPILDRETERVIDDERLAINGSYPTAANAEEYLSDAANIAVDPPHAISTKVRNLLEVIQLSGDGTFTFVGNQEGSVLDSDYGYAHQVFLQDIKKLIEQKGRTLEDIFVRAIQNGEGASAVTREILRAVGEDGLIEFQRRTVERAKLIASIVETLDTELREERHGASNQ